MRSEKEMMDLVLSLAEQDERIRIVTLEGSRANINIPKDEFQDYDITYFVSDIEPFISNDDWLNQFGNIIMMQKPEDMELFPPEEKGFSYLMLFDDYNKIDLTLLPLEELDNYLKGDKLIKVLIDKDCRIKRDIVPTDIDYHVRKPSAREYDDCCNEFWNVTPYVIKGLCRKEILFAIDHFNQIVRHELLRMISWKVGIETGFKLSVGKNYKFIERYISEDLWEKLLSTYRMDSYENIWEALFLCHQLFRAVSGEVAERLHYAYPEYDRNITKYTRDMYKKYTGKTGCLDSTYAADIEERRYIEDIAVCKDFRGQGIGSALINISIEWAKHKNLHGLMLETQDNNLIACKFYHNCGFKIGSVDTMLYANFENNFEKAVFWYLRF